MLEHIHVQRAFIGARGISLERGFFCGNAIEGETKRRMMACAAEKFVVADSSKFHVTGLVPFAGFEDFDYLLVDRLDDPTLVSALREKGIKLVTCQAKPSSGRRKQ